MNKIAIVALLLISPCCFCNDLWNGTWGFLVNGQACALVLKDGNDYWTLVDAKEMKMTGYKAPCKREGNGFKNSAADSSITVLCYVQGKVAMTYTLFNHKEMHKNSLIGYYARYSVNDEYFGGSAVYLYREVISD